MSATIAELLEKYDPERHRRRVEIAVGSKTFELNDFCFMFDPVWSTPANKLPNKISSLLLDSYYQLPDRPDLAFACLWMAFNSTFAQTAVRDSYAKNKENLTDTFGLECAAEVIVGTPNIAIAVDGSTRSLMDLLIIAIQAIPEKLTSMIATNAVRAVAFQLQLNSRRYESKAFTGLRSNFPALGQLIERCHGEAYSDGVVATIGAANAEGILTPINPEKSQAIIRSLSACFLNLFRTGSVTMTHHASTQTVTLSFTERDRISLFLRYVLYASRNNLAHGKVSSRLNSDTANPQSYKVNLYIYVSLYICLGILLVDLGFASNVIVGQAIQNLKIILPKPIATY